MGMGMAERVELDALRERVAELARRVVALEQAMVKRFDAEREIVVREPLHLKDSKRGK